jgi:transcriptional regulator with XRE-family HTH domain
MSTDIAKSDFSAKLRAWRKRQGWSQQNLADALRVPLRTYVGWEAGRGPDHPEVVMMALEALWVPCHTCRTERECRHAERCAHSDKEAA